MMDLEHAGAAFLLWRWLRHQGLADISLANRLAPVALAYWAALEPDPAVVVKR
jgi:hypothetical protein